VIQIREGLRDEAAQTSATTRAACGWGVKFCDTLLDSLQERATRVAQAQASASVPAVTDLGGHRADFNTDRSHLPTYYNSNWPVYRREADEKKDRKKTAARTEAFFRESAKADWAKRAAQARTTAEGVYEHFRMAARQAEAVK
jgi:hypothetical protein